MRTFALLLCLFISLNTAAQDQCKPIYVVNPDFSEIEAFLYEKMLSQRDNIRKNKESVVSDMLHFAKLHSAPSSLPTGYLDKKLSKLNYEVKWVDSIDKSKKVDGKYILLSRDVAVSKGGGQWSWWQLSVYSSTHELLFSENLKTTWKKLKREHKNQ